MKTLILLKSMNTHNYAKHGHNQIKICVSGAAETGHCGIDALEKAKELGKEIARQGAVLLTGATTGFPLWVAMGAKEAGGFSIGFSPAASEREHVEVYKLPLDYLDLIVYTGFGYPGRDLLLTRSSDAVICGCEIYVIRSVNIKILDAVFFHFRLELFHHFRRKLRRLSSLWRTRKNLERFTAPIMRALRRIEDSPCG